MNEDPTVGDERIPRSLLGYSPGQGTEANRDRPPHVAAADPLGWCVIATTALLAWLIGPPAVAAMAVIGFIRYWRAWRSGRTDSQCLLGDIRLVLAYLAVIAAATAVATVFSLT